MRTYLVETRRQVEVPTAVVFGEVSPDELAEWLERVHARVAAYLTRVGAGPIGMPFACFHPMGDEPVEMEAGYVALIPVPGEGDVEPSVLPGGTVAVTCHVGPRSALADAYRAVDAWIRDQGGEPSGDAWEVHQVDAGREPAGWRTEVTEVFRPYRPAASPAVRA